MKARRGSTSFANDWQWVIGIPASAWVVTAFHAKGTAEFFASGTQFAAFTNALAAFVITVLASILIRLFIEPADLFYSEERRAILSEEELKKSRAPKIKLYLDPVQQGVMELPTEINGVRATSKWVQFTVAPNSDTPLMDCEAWVVDIERLDGIDAGAHILEERARCLWSQLAIDKEGITIRPLLYQRANLFSIGPGNGESPRPTLTPVKFRLADALLKPGKFRLNIVVTAEGAISQSAKLIFEWRDFQNISLLMES